MTRFNILSDSAREQATNAMHSALATLVDLALQGKQAHWNIRGPRFKSLHEHLDEIVDAARMASDEVAERIVTLGVAADGTLAGLSKNTALKSIKTGFLKDNEVAELVAGQLSKTIETLRSAIGKVGEVDPISEDLLIGISSGLEKQLWMMQSNFLEA